MRVSVRACVRVCVYICVCMSVCAHLYFISLFHFVSSNSRDNPIQHLQGEAVHKKAGGDRPEKISEKSSRMRASLHAADTLLGGQYLATADLDL